MALGAFWKEIVICIRNKVQELKNENAMHIIPLTPEDFFEQVKSKIAPVNTVLDIGCGIRPQNFIMPTVHVCCDAHREYLDTLQSTITAFRNNDEEFTPNEFCTITRENSSEFILLNQDWSSAIEKFLPKSFDTVFLLDIIEHLEKEEGKRLIRETEKLCRRQMVIFTPLGFIEQEHENETDAWGLSGALLQKHLSGWEPNDFDDSWTIYVCGNFHTHDNMGELYEDAKGAFFAIKNFIPAESMMTDSELIYWNLLEESNFYIETGNYEEARKGYLGCISLLPHLPYAFNGLGIANLNIGQMEEAYLSFREAGRLNPEERLFLMNYAGILERKGELKTALNMCLKALNITSDKEGIENTLIENNFGEFINTIAPFNINNIRKITLINNYPYSRIYKTEIEGRELVYKVIKKNYAMDFTHVIQSYRNLIVNPMLEGLVKIYDFRLSKEGDSIEILMESLIGWQSLTDLGKDERKAFGIKALEILSELIDKDIIPFDAGIVNFMTDGNEVKMIDLDFMLTWKEMNQFYSKWFITRLEGIAAWCPELKPEAARLISVFSEKSSTYFKNLIQKEDTDELLYKGEELISQENYVEAVHILNSLINKQPNCAECFNDLAVAHLELKNPVRSMLLLETAIERDPENSVYAENYRELISKHSHDEVIKEITQNRLPFQNNEELLKRLLKDSPDLIEEIKELQNRVDSYTYPNNYAFDIVTLNPKGQLKTRMDYWRKYSPELLYQCSRFLSIGSSLGYLEFYHSATAKSCTGVEPDKMAVEIVNKIKELRNCNNIHIHNMQIGSFERKEKYDLIWMGNVFHYIYAEFGWKSAKVLAELSDGICVIEAPLEGEFLMAQSDLNPLWKNTKLMSDYTSARFNQEMSVYFDIVRINPSGTDPVNRVLVVLRRNSVMI